MNALVKPVMEVADIQTPAIEFQSNPVLLTEQLAKFYGTDAIRIQQNHARNSERFIEGKHFYKVEGDQLRNLKDSLTSLKIVSPNARSLMLWTEKGAARHAKMLDTDQAWNVFEQLEECYFTVKNNAISLPNFNNPIEAARVWADEMEAKQIAWKERDEAKAQVEVMQSDVDALALISKSERGMCITDAAKTLGIQRNKLVKWLEVNSWCYRRQSNGKLVGYQDKVKSEYLEHKTYPYIHSDGTHDTDMQVLILPKGLTRLSKLLGNNHV